MKRPKVIASIVVALLFLVVLLQNDESVAVDFLFWDATMPKIVLIPLTMTVGFVLGFLVAKMTGQRHAPQSNPGPPNPVPPL